MSAQWVCFFHWETVQHCALLCPQRAIQSRKSMLKTGQQLSLSLFSIHSLSFSLSFHFFSPGAQCLDSDKVKAVQIICQQVNYIGMPVAELWAEVKPGARTCPRKHCRSGLPEDKARSRASHEIRHTCGQAVLSPYIGLALNAQLGGCNMVYFDDGHFLSQRGPGM